MTIITEQNVAFNYLTFFLITFKIKYIVYMNNEHTCYVFNVRIGIKKICLNTYTMSWSPPLCACELLLTGSLIISSRPRRGWSQVRRSRSPDNCLILKIVNKMCQHGILFALIIAWQFIFLQILALYLSNIQQILLLTLQGFCGYFIHFPKSTDNRLTFCLNVKKLHV